MRRMMGLCSTASSTATLSLAATAPSAAHSSHGTTAAAVVHRPIGAIAGGVVGGVAAVALLLLLAFCWCRRRLGGGVAMIQRVRIHEPMHGPPRREPAFDIDDDGVATQPPMLSLPTPPAAPIEIPVVQQISSLGLVSQSARTESPNNNNSDASRNPSTTSTTSAKQAYRNALAIRREAIAREMRGIREYATDFQRPRLPFPGIDNNSRNSEDHADSLSLSFAAEELKQQIGSLQTQVERL